MRNSICFSPFILFSAILLLVPSAFAISMRQAQWNLAGLAYLKYTDVDGFSGPTTSRSLIRFQTDRCLSASGSLSSATSAELVSVMKAVQSKVGITGRAADGLNGPNTKAAIEAFQQRNGLTPDGLAGSRTFSAMGLTRVKSCNTGGNTGSTTGAPVGNVYDDSSAVRCASGTTDLGVSTGYSRGTAIRIRLCAIPGFRSTSSESQPSSRFYVSGANRNVIVNSRVSAAILALYRAALSDGRTLTARSSFRTMAHQQSLCQGNALCRGGTYSFVARPGYSSHQLGIAVDFAGTRVKGGRTCATRAKDTTSSTWTWLENNARRYSFKQYSRESWHWDVFPLSNRC